MEVTFLQKSYGVYSKDEKLVLVTISYEGSDDDEELKVVPFVDNNNNVNKVSDSDSDDDIENDNENFFDEDIHDEAEATPQTNINAKVVCVMKKLQTMFNHDAHKIVKQATKKSAIKNINFLMDLAMVTNNTKPVPEEPKIFNETWHHPNKNSYKKWQEAIHKEFANINKQQILHMTHKNLMPPNCRWVKNRWVFKIKCNGVYRACLVACRYSQVPHANFSKSYSPVVNNITFCILLLMVLHFGYSAKIVDVETTFLYGDLEVEMYMDCLQGMPDMQKDDCIILNKCIYGLVQVKRQYYNKTIKILKNLGFVRGNVNPCLYMKKSGKGIVYIALYIDDNLMIGNMATIDNTIEALKNKGLVLKIVEGLQDYLFCKTKFSDDKKRTWLGQSHLMKNKKKKFGKHMQNIWSYKPQGTPKFLTVRPMVTIYAEDKQDYWLGIGMLLYLIKQCQKAPGTLEVHTINYYFN